MTSVALREGEGFFDRLETVKGAADAKALFLDGADSIIFPDLLRVLPDEEPDVKFFVEVRAFKEGDKRFGVAVIKPTEIAFGVRTAKHGLNNALMGLVGYTELLKGQSDLTDRAREKVAAISREVDKMQERVTTLGELARRIAKSD